MKYWFDTEFIEDGKTIELLSIGIVSEDGREFYLENHEADLNHASFWVRANVFGSMLWTPDAQEDRETIRRRVLDFCDVERYGEPEFWAYYADYDWVALCQLFGRMVDLPPGWPMYCRDFKQLVGDREIPKLPEDEAHNALADARWLRDSFDNFYRPSGQRGGA